MRLITLLFPGERREVNVTADDVDKYGLTLHKVRAHQPSRADQIHICLVTYLPMRQLDSGGDDFVVHLFSRGTGGP